MSLCATQPSTPRGVRTLNQSVRRLSTSRLSSRPTVWNTGKPRPGPVRISRMGAVTKTCTLLLGATLYAAGAANKGQASRRIRGSQVLIDWRVRIERVVEILSPNVQPLGNQTQLGAGQPSRMGSTGREAVEEPGGTARVARQHRRIHRHWHQRRLAVRSDGTRNQPVLQ